MSSRSSFSARTPRVYVPEKMIFCVSTANPCSVAIFFLRSPIWGNSVGGEPTARDGLVKTSLTVSVGSASIWNCFCWRVLNVIFIVGSCMGASDVSDGHEKDGEWRLSAQRRGRSSSVRWLHGFSESGTHVGRGAGLVRCRGNHARGVSSAASARNSHKTHCYRKPLAALSVAFSLLRSTASKSLPRVICTDRLRTRWFCSSIRSSSCGRASSATVFVRWAAPRRTSAQAACPR